MKNRKLQRLARTKSNNENIPYTKALELLQTNNPFLEAIKPLLKKNQELWIQDNGTILEVHHGIPVPIGKLGLQNQEIIESIYALPEFIAKKASALYGYLGALDALNVVIKIAKQDVSERASNSFGKEPLVKITTPRYSPTETIAFGKAMVEAAGLQEKIAAWQAEDKNILVVGPTGSGKTTLLSYLLASKPSQYTIITESHPELWLSKSKFGKRVLMAMAQDSFMVDLSLNYKQDRLVIGEIRGGYGGSLLQTAERHKGQILATMHAPNAQQAIRALSLSFGEICEHQKNKITELFDVVITLERDQGVRKIIEATSSENVRAPSLLSKLAHFADDADKIKVQSFDKIFVVKNGEETLVKETLFSSADQLKASVINLAQSEKNFSATEKGFQRRVVAQRSDKLYTIHFSPDDEECLIEWDKPLPRLIHVN